MNARKILLPILVVTAFGVNSHSFAMRGLDLESGAKLRKGDGLQVQLKEVAGFKDEPQERLKENPVKDLKLDSVESGGEKGLQKKQDSQKVVFEGDHGSAPYETKMCMVDVMDQKEFEEYQECQKEFKENQKEFEEHVLKFKLFNFACDKISLFELIRFLLCASKK